VQKSTRSHLFLFYYGGHFFSSPLNSRSGKGLPLALHVRGHVRANPAIAGTANSWLVFPVPASSLGLSRRTPPPTRGIGKFQTAGKSGVLTRRL